MIEEKIVDFFQSLKCLFLDKFFEFTNFLGSELFFFLVFFLIYWTYRKNYAFKYMLVYVVSFGFNALLKNIIRRPRPHNLQGYGFSFPSGHAQSYGAVVGQLYYEAKIHNKPTKKWLKVEFLLDVIIGAILVGCGRMYFGMHYPTDVIAGFLIGIYVITAATFLFNYWGTKININLKKILPLLIPVAIGAYFLVTFVDVFDGDSLLRIYAFIGMYLGVTIGYLLDCRFVKYDSTDTLKNRIKKGVWGTIVMVVLYFVTVYQIKTPYLTPIAYFIIGVVGTFLLPLIFKKLFIEEEKEIETK